MCRRRRPRSKCMYVYEQESSCRFSFTHNFLNSFVLCMRGWSYCNKMNEVRMFFLCLCKIHDMRVTLGKFIFF